MDEADEEFTGENRRHLQIIKEFNKKYDALHYVLLYPRGQNSWGFYMPQAVSNRDKKYKPPVPHKIRTANTDEELLQICMEYGLLMECSRSAKIQQIKEYEIAMKKVTSYSFLSCSMLTYLLFEQLQKLDSMNKAEHLDEFKSIAISTIAETLNVSNDLNEIIEGYCLSHCEHEGISEDSWRSVVIYYCKLFNI